MEDVAAGERAALLIAVPSASIAFMLGFNLGAFGEIFFEQILTVWVIATIVLVASFFSKLPPNGWAGRLLLLVPTVWLILAAVADPTQPEDRASKFIFGLTIFVTAVCLPFIGWILVSAINPDFTHLTMPRRIAILAAVIVFAGAGFFIGARNDVFLTCEDFEVSGNFVPSKCVREYKEPAGALDGAPVPLHLVSVSSGESV
jgi:hypothetical protein